jgi:PTS system fructose-specific IIA component
MIISEELIQLDLDATSQEDALRALAEVAAKNGKVNNKENYIKAVLKREEEYSTAVGFGVAIPHGKTDAVNEPFVMFARVAEMDWKALDGNPIDLIFLIGVPTGDASTTHLKILASISRKLMQEEFRNSLRSAKSPAEIITVLKENAIGI